MPPPPGLRLRLRPPSPEGREKSGRESSFVRCERVGEVDGARAVARNRYGPLLSRYGDRMRIFGSRQGSVATGSRERPAMGFVQPAGVVSVRPPNLCAA